MASGKYVIADGVKPERSDDDWSENNRIMACRLGVVNIELPSSWSVKRYRSQQALGEWQRSRIMTTMSLKRHYQLFGRLRDVSLRTSCLEPSTSQLPVECTWSYPTNVILQIEKRLWKSVLHSCSHRRVVSLGDRLIFRGMLLVNPQTLYHQVRVCGEKVRY